MNTNEPLNILLNRRFKKEFDKVYKALSYQIYYGEMLILRDVLLKNHIVYSNLGDYKWYYRFKEILKIK